MALLRRLLAAAAALSALAAAGACLAQAEATPQEVKAAFLYRFGAFVDWPAGVPAEEFVIGVLGAEEVEAVLRSIAARRQVQGRPVVVRRIEADEDTAGVQVLYVGARAARHARAVRAATERAALIVTDQPDGLEHGGMINFITTDRVQFEIAPEAASRAGLRLSPRLLQVAVRLKRGECCPERLFV